MSLATSVLSHGLVDLGMFTLFFIFSIYAFAQLFFIQLGPCAALPRPTPPHPARPVHPPIHPPVCATYSTRTLTLRKSPYLVHK